ncbi:MAG: hypothetical protein LBC19_14915 [Tannerella sp.]|jgi:hypothetical protein|nr:hypothetical protein [Tannerella sp.]
MRKLERYKELKSWNKRNYKSKRNFYLPVICACLAGICKLSSVHANPIGENVGEIKPSILYYDSARQIDRLEFQLVNGSRIKDRNGAEWELSVNSSPVEGQPDALDYQLVWRLLKGEAQNVAAGVDILFSQWTGSEFVFVPAIVYDGNRFAVKRMNYPPFWYDKSEWRIDMPTTTTGLPALNEDSKHRIEINTGNAATPLMAFHSPEKQQGWILLTTQGSRFGNHGMYIEEFQERSEAKFSLTAPDVREFATVASSGSNSPSTVGKWEAGDTLAIRFRLYSFKSNAIKDMMKRFYEVRKELNPYERKEVLPFSEAGKLLSNLFLHDRWDENINMFCLSKPGSGTQWCFIWQLGWVGGGQCTLPLMMQGSEELRRNAIKNLDVIFSKSQAPSGFFNAYGNGVEFTGFGYYNALKNNETLVRSQGDWLYMAQRQFEEMESKGDKVPPQWKSGLQKQADAFVRLWNKYGQFGQFVDVVTGDICIGRSTSGAIVCGGLALASQTFRMPEYLKVAENAAEKYYNEYVLKGYTTGGPGEILSAPDSESAFGLFESFVTLYEVTGNKKWLDYASDLLPVCASWTVSYDYRFPESSIMGKLDARSYGSVWASVSNKHSAPGICTWSGDCLLKYFRASNDRRAIELLTDIAHGVPQYISRSDRPIGKMPPGGICERVNLSNWEGKRSIGGNIFGSCSWCETAALLTVTQLPGIYAQPDAGFYTVFDNIKVELIDSGNKLLHLRLTNPTGFPADVKIFSESSKQARQTSFRINSKNVQTVHLDPNESKELKLK